jgi:hypothetical protein
MVRSLSFLVSRPLFLLAAPPVAPAASPSSHATAPSVSGGQPLLCFAQTIAHTALVHCGISVLPMPGSGPNAKNVRTRH